MITIFGIQMSAGTFISIAVSIAASLISAGSVMGVLLYKMTQTQVISRDTNKKVSRMLKFFNKKFVKKADFNRSIQSHEERLDDHEDRLRTVEGERAEILLLKDKLQRENKINNS